MNKRFDELKKFLNFDSWKQFADYFGTKDSRIYSYRNEQASIPKELLDTFKEKGFNPEWIDKGIEPMLIGDIPELNGSRGVPFYPIDVTASILRSFSDVPERPDFFVDFKPLNDCTAYLTVYGDSMYPRYCSGDIVAVKKINSNDSLLWGEAYLVITTEEANSLRTIKLVHQHPDNDYIILRASNPDYSGDTVIKKEYIANLFLVKGKIKLEHL